MNERIKKSGWIWALVFASGYAYLSMPAQRVSAQYPDELLQQLWSAQWITASDVPQRDPVVLHFRKVIELWQKPEHFVVHVSADNQFLLYVNQQWVGFGPARSDLQHWKYETYDLAPMLHAGTNVLAATVWNFGVLTPLAQISDRTGFVLHGNDEATRIADTNESWLVEREKGIQVLRAPEQVRRKYYVAEPAEQIDGMKFDWEWNSASADKQDQSQKWKQAQPIERAELRGSALQNTNWGLVPDSLPPMERELISVGRVVRTEGIDTNAGFPGKPITIPANAKVSILIDTGHLTTAYPQLTLSGGRDSTVHLTYAEALFDDKGQKGNRNEIAGKHIEGIFDEFVADGAANRTFMPLGWKTWRYLQVDVTTSAEPLQIDKLQAWFTAYPFEERGYFHSDDASLQPIWDVSWRTARLDAHDTYMDTPYYERMQYVGDTRIQALISYSVAGDDRLARQAIEAFNNSRIPDGLTRSRYPSSVRQIIPTFSLLWVGMVHDFWMYRDDHEFVRSQLAGTRTVLDWFLKRQRSDGMLGKIDWWPFVDWGSDFSFGIPPQDKDGGSSIITLQFVEALRYAAELESSLGDAHRAEIYKSAADRAASAVYKLCWNQQYGLLADTPAQKHYSQHANILGVWLDVIPREQQKSTLIQVLASREAWVTPAYTGPSLTQATYYFRFYLARAFDHAGLGNMYLSLLDPWRQMIANGMTTWAESPEPTRSDSHAWSAHPDYDFLTTVAGIRPQTPGFGAIIVEPHLGKLKHVSAGMSTPKGMVEVDCIAADNGSLKANITLPSGMAGEFLWNAKPLELHGGKQELTLPAKDSR